MTKKLYPNLRFIEFNEDWKNYSLSEVADFFNEKRIPIEAEKRISGKYPYYGATGIIDYVNDYIFEGEYILLAEDGANIITRTSPITYVTKDKFWVNNHAHILRSKSGTNIFLSHVLENQNYVQYNSGTAQPKLNSQIVKKINVFLPTYEEQLKIGIFLEKINKIITLYQEELNALKQTKQGFLQKMFPKDGETIPEIRFSEFTADWTNEVLENHVIILTGGTPKTNNSELWFPKEVPWLSSGEVNKKRIRYTDNKISKKGLNSSSARWVESHSVLIALAGQGKTRGTVAINEIPLTTNQSIAALTPKKSLDAEFLYQSLGKRYEELRMISSGGGTRGGLNKKILSELIIQSTNIEEQVKIGNFFKQIDQVIELKEKEIESLNQTKKGFLQKMFV